VTGWADDRPVWLFSRLYRRPPTGGLVPVDSRGPRLVPVRSTVFEPHEYFERWLVDPSRTRGTLELRVWQWSNGQWVPLHQLNGPLY
jgi:hypothetical protein